MDKYSEERKRQLGMDAGTASAQLRKSLLFSMAKRLKEDVCYQCGNVIENVNDFTIEHKAPWLHAENATELFFSLDNIAFSHYACNVRASRKRPSRCDHKSTYSRGCRCAICTTSQRKYVAKYRASKKANSNA